VIYLFLAILECKNYSWEFSMKRVAYVSAVLGLLVFGGCSKQPVIDTTMNDHHPVENTAVITPVSNANPVDTANTATVTDVKTVNSVLFDYNKFDVRPDMQAVVKTDGELVKNKAVKLEGNCDEFGSDEYNLALGLKRANAVKSALVEEGVNPESISMTSLGESNPVCTEKTQECWAKNRRVDFKLP
jgi:peptidoglycan-associated lipoprotein